MKYEIKILTKSGPVTEVFNPSFETLERFEYRMINKYGTFVMLNAKQI